MELKCNQYRHLDYPIQTICCKIDCQQSRPACSQCMIDHHHNHIKEMKNIQVFKEWSESKQIIFQKLKAFQNDLLEFVYQFDELIRSISIDCTQRMENCNLKELDEFVNKFIYLDQLESAILNNQTIPILTLAITSLKQEIKNLKGRTNSFYTNKQTQGSMQTQNSLAQIVEHLYYRSIIMVLPCPLTCVCKSLNQGIRNWYCKCGQQYYLEETGNIRCLTCGYADSLIDFNFQCEKAQKIKQFFQNQTPNTTLQQIAIGMQGSKFLHKDLIDFYGKLIQRIIMRWNP